MTSFLGRHLKRAGLTAESLARQINHENGPGTISLKAPYGWIEGSVPRGQMPELVACLLSRRLGERITVADIWPSRPETPSGFCDTDDHSPWSRAGFTRFLDIVSGVRPDEPCAPRSPLPAIVDWVTGVGEGVTPVAHDDAAELSIGVRHAAVRAAHLCGAEFLVQIARLEWLQHELARAGRMISELDPGSADVEELMSVIADLCRAAGAVAYQRGETALGVHYYLAGLHACSRNGGVESGLRIVSELAEHMTWSGMATDALRMIKLVRTAGLAERIDRPDIDSVLAHRSACSAAQLGLVDEFAGFVDSDRELTVPAWTEPGLLTCELGGGWLSLDEAERGCRLLHDGIELMGAGDAPQLVGHRLDLAHGYIRLGKVNRGVSEIRRVMTNPVVLDSARNRDRLRGIESSLRRRSSQAVGEIDLLHYL